MKEPIAPFDFEQLTREDLQGRGGKVTLTDFGKPSPGDALFARWYYNLPNILAGAELRALVEAIVAARQSGKPCHLAMGAHVVKVGLAPILADLLERHIVTSVSVNGAFVIHDFEIAAAGFTSEDVGATLGDGSFGMSEQTGRAVADMVTAGDTDGIGLGRAAARHIGTGGFPHADHSLLAACHRYEVPVTVHAAPGTDIVHLHPALDAAAFGRVLMHDFRVFTTLVSRLAGGVYINIGSAVLLPEVFLKALTAARNAGHAVDGLTCANLDFIRQYRPLTNVVTRPVAEGGRGINLVGHHEILVPLLAAALVHRMWMPLEDP